MRLFGKKKKDEDEELDEDESYKNSKDDRKKRFPKSKEFKDLNPDNKRRRKEPVKPWGKGERIFILVILLITVGASGVLSLYSRSWKLPGLPRLRIPLFFSNANKVDNANSNLEYDQEFLEIRQLFQTKTSLLTGLYALSVAKTEDGVVFGENNREAMQAASLIKLPVMAAMYAEAEKGNVNLDSIYTLRNIDKVGGAGSLAAKPAGTRLTYRELLELMGKQSDNTAFSIVRHKLGDAKIEEYIKIFRMTDTSLSKNMTSAYDITVFFNSLWQEEIVNKESKEEILQNLTDTYYENWLAAGIPDGFKVAHKYGREVHVVNDAGIIFADTPFILVILSEGIVDKEADQVIPELANGVYNILVNEPE